MAGARPVLMITNHGAHEPEHWAMVTAEVLFDIAPNTEHGRMLLAKRTQLAIADALLPHHHGAQHRERDHLKGGSHRLHVEYVDDKGEALAEANEALTAINEVLKSTPWADRFNDRSPGKDEEGKDMLSPRQVALNEIASHFMSVKHIERSWHKDRLAAKQGA